MITGLVAVPTMLVKRIAPYCLVASRQITSPGLMPSLRPSIGYMPGGTTNLQVEQSTGKAVEVRDVISAVDVSVVDVGDVFLSSSVSSVHEKIKLTTAKLKIALTPSLTEVCFD